MPIACIALLALTILALYRDRHPAERVLRVGVDSFAPYCYWGAGGKPEGFAVEMLAEAARRRHISLQWVNPVQGGDKSLVEGTADLWLVMAPTPKRLARIHVTRPFLRDDFCVLSAADKPAGVSDSLAGFRLAYT